ncbi:hypothetical protein RchiOBHm_Chr2g0088801 [Rosa chinensis]|uniref:Uncharacterized protein n=1 Tax=Rosa chinensis TaxID=74649 RepID=A0A2P6RIZ8_ROSCH|nr:hypothetical protein RchiOBHm_Chr2g0088801 [Rosa chinensis]
MKIGVWASSCVLPMVAVFWGYFYQFSSVHGIDDYSVRLISSKRFICCLSRLEVREGYVLKMFGTCMVRAFWELTITKHYNVGSLKLEPTVTVRLVYLGMLLEDENLGQLQMMGNSASWMYIVTCKSLCFSAVLNWGACREKGCRTLELLDSNSFRIHFVSSTKYSDSGDIVMGSYLFGSFPCKDGCKLRVYDEATDSWSKHIDSKIHLGNSRALEAASLVPLNGKLCIIRNNMSISLVDVSKSNDAGGASAEHLWETLAGKGQFRTMVTNLWSSLAGRNRLKSHIVHCQVLQA